MQGVLERVLPEWSVAAGAVHWVTPPGGLRPRRVVLLGAFFADQLSSGQMSSRPAHASTRGVPAGCTGKAPAKVQML